ncbi:YqhR family membrane protein [Paenibacillus caui]|uniref:YqhR family membrane protein n=1 Tax=Paenibacillus caui TaxID=2873927 RepID=UPI001CA83C64|nr:YqhR family membrane protein [Paenibacillus caui]
MAQQKNENTKKKTDPVWFALELGFFAGLIWGAVHGFFYFMRFTIVIPGFLAEPFFKHAYLKTQPGYFIGWLYFTVFSVIASLLYVLILRKLKGPWPGILYGIWWWVVIYGVLSPSLMLTEPLRTMGWTSVISEFCLFVLWGLFIGYTTALEFTEDRLREPEKSPA